MTVRDDTGVKKPLRADAERNRRRIVDAARELFASRGIDITLDDVAAHAKVGVGTVYRRFSCKEELIDGVFEQRLEDMLACAEESLLVEDPWDGLVLFLTKLFEGISADKGLGDVVLGTDEGCNGIARMRERIDPFVERIVTRAKDSGRLRADVEVNDLFPLIGMVNAASEFMSCVEPANWKRYFAIVMDGLRADSGMSALPGRALTTDEITAAKAEMHRRRR
ncbi:MAG: TetR/AcrR family transcriptional regulator [Rhodococcus sp. (in: high G+C Gram-positive bacteria)]|jgi:AcrR family transcriptional regulator|uniref:TetR/AcrR family transcriptional regulator n=1 Tax=Rhodococcus sp. EPR-157 TaxID=1813677 RepID=UPI0007BBD182|nr:TetR/AcrR family transcriptional regulator [Rhodococcus sp. EPR-157]KZF01101.1 TetR family transcriptional regulator [Rhodococcus sp. EPR-157]